MGRPGPEGQILGGNRQWREEFDNTNVCQSDDMRMAGPETRRETQLGESRDDGLKDLKLSNYCCPNPPGAAPCPRFNGDSLKVSEFTNATFENSPSSVGATSDSTMREELDSLNISSLEQRALSVGVDGDRVDDIL